MHIFDLFERLHPPNNFKNKKQALGALPKPPLSCEAAGAGGKPYPPTPTVSVGSIQGVKGKMRLRRLDPSPSPWGSKTNRSGRAGNLSRLAKQPRSPAFTGWRRQRSVVRVQEVFLHPCHVANAGVGSAHGVKQDPWGSRSRGKCAVGTHLRVWVYKAQSQLCVAFGCLVIGGRMSAVSLKLPHAPCAPLSLDNLQVLVQSLPMAFG